MTSTLAGVYNAQRSLSLNQAVIDLISNNISNVNTPGYSKQRAELSQLNGSNDSNTAQGAIYNSQGAVIDAITRNREAYLDDYYRKENTALNYYKELNENARFIEDMTNELNDVGVNNSLNKFYESLNQLASNPTDIVMRNSVIQNATELCTQFNSMYSQLDDLRISLAGDYTDPNTLETSKIKLMTDDLNDKLESIADLNKTIIQSQAEGSAPNHLLDQRDKLLDEVSSLIPVDITHQTNGSTTITAGNTDLVVGGNQIGHFGVATGDADNPAILQIENETGGVLISDASSIINSGKLGAILEMSGSDPNKLTIKGAMDNIDTLASEFAEELNDLQVNGQYMMEDPLNPGEYILTVDDGDPLNPPFAPPNFFVDDAEDVINITAENIKVSDSILDNPYQIAAADISSDAEETGDGSNALKMAQLRNKLMVGLGGATPEQYMVSIVGEIGNKTSSIKNNYEIKDNISQQVSSKRESVTGVNLDEEMVDLVKFQRSYEASARVFNVVDSNIQTILNMVR